MPDLRPGSPARAALGRLRPERPLAARAPIAAGRTDVCPGHAVAMALACGVLDGFREAGWQAVPGQSIGYEPRPNLCVPHQILMARA
jgi:hypothetical protein